MYLLIGVTYVEGTMGVTYDLDIFHATFRKASFISGLRPFINWGSKVICFNM